jgi:hypothetical protein
MELDETIRSYIDAKTTFGGREIAFPDGLEKSIEDDKGQIFPGLVLLKKVTEKPTDSYEDHEGRKAIADYLLSKGREFEYYPFPAFFDTMMSREDIISLVQYEDVTRIMFDGEGPGEWGL